MSPGQELAGRRQQKAARAGWFGRRPRFVLARTMRVMVSDRMSLSAAGCAFYATFALFPAISILIFLYGLVFDPHTVEPQLRNLQSLVPPPAYALIADRVHALVTRGESALSLGLIVSIAITYWSASTGTKSLLSALNLAYGEQERRGFLGFQMVGLGMTLFGIVAAAIGLAIVVGLPAAIGFFDLSGDQRTLVRLGGLGGLLVFVLVILALLYRYGPSRGPGAHHVVLPGAVIATVIWIAISLLFSLYVTRVAQYNLMYGPLAAVIGMMVWFYVGAYVVLFGAELNAALEFSREATAC